MRKNIKREINLQLFKEMEETSGYTYKMIKHHNRLWKRAHEEFRIIKRRKERELLLMIALVGGFQGLAMYDEA